MALDIPEVRRIAELARLELSPAEEESLARRLGEIVGYFDQLRRFETAEAGSSASSGDAAEAADEPAPGLPLDRFLDNAPAALDGFLVVPRVVDDG